MMGRFGIPEDEPIETRLISRALESAQVGRLRGFNFDARKHILEYDDVIESTAPECLRTPQKTAFGEKEYIKEFVSGLSKGR